MSDGMKKDKSLSNYVFFGAFLGSLVGTAIVLFSLAESSEEKKEQIRELRQELLKPVSNKLVALIDEIGDLFRKTLENVSQ